jgi:hypothetical protein
MKQPLLESLERLMSSWKDVFSQERIFQRVRRLTLGMIVSLRQHLTSNAICATGRQFQDWSADYRVCSQSPWEARQLFDPVLDELPQLLHTAQAPVLAAIDDSLFKKTGRKIPGVTIGRDAMSPPFHVNLCYGLRFVQLSVLVTAAGGGAARAIPVRFEFAPPAVKPKSKRKNKNGDNAVDRNPKEVDAESPEQIAYKKEQKLRRLTRVGANAMGSLRQSMDERPELKDRELIISGDATYTTRVVLQGLPHDTAYIGRIRKDAKFHWPLPAVVAAKGKGRPRKYGLAAPTPQQILDDKSIPWKTVTCFAAGESRHIRVKKLGPLYWRKGGVDLPLQVVVVKTAGYRLRKGGKLHYRRPAFLICTDPELDLRTLVQSYIYRWEIECNHRDEKSFLGVAQGQVRNPESVRRLPQLQVASYSLLQLAALLSYGFQRAPGAYLPLPIWRRIPASARPSLLDIMNLLREQIFAHASHVPIHFDTFTSTQALVVKSSKLPLTAETLSTVAA